MLGNATVEKHLLGVFARPSMFVVRVSVDAVVAYVSGYDAALGGSALIGFQQWLIARGAIGNNQHWTALLLHADPSDSEMLSRMRDLLGAYFSFRREHGLTRVFYDYALWLRRKRWYSEALRDPPARPKSRRSRHQ